MADVYFRKVKTLAGTYWQLYRVDNVKPKERSGLSLTVQEYQAVCGDIGSPDKVVAAMLQNLRDEMQRDGHALHFNKPV